MMEPIISKVADYDKQSKDYNGVPWTVYNYYTRTNNRKIQLIVGDVFDANYLLDSFDFSICKCNYDGIRFNIPDPYLTLNKITRINRNLAKQVHHEIHKVMEALEREPSEDEVITISVDTNNLLHRQLLRFEKYASRGIQFIRPPKEFTGHHFGLDVLVNASNAKYFGEDNSEKKYQEVLSDLVSRRRRIEWRI